MSFFNLKKRYFVIEIPGFFCFCEIHKFQNLWHHHRHCWIWKLHFSLFLWILNTIKMKFGQILLYLITNISNIFLSQCWRLETSSMLFYYFKGTLLGLRQFLTTESPLKMMKKAFYPILKALLILKILKLLSLLFGHV